MNRQHWRPVIRNTVVLPLCLLVAGCGAMGGGSIQRAFTKEEKCRLLIEWASRFEKEYPAAFFTTERWGKRYNAHAGFNQKIPNLYRDEYFLPVFGARYDELTEEGRTKLYRSIVPPCQGRGYPEMRLYNDLMLGLGYSKVQAEQMERSVISDRLRAQWKDRIVAELKTLSPSDESYAKLEEWAKAGVRDLVDFWPSEQRGFTATLEEARKRLGSAALVARIDKALAEPPSYANLVALEKLLNRSTELYAAIPDALAGAQRERVRTGLHERLKFVWEQERVRFDARGSGLAGLEQGAAFVTEFDKRYSGVFEDNPVIQEMEAYVKNGRLHDLERSQGILKAEIQRAKSAQDIAALQRRYLPLDVDEGQRHKLQAVIALKNDSLKLEQEHWKFSDRERTLMSQPFQIDVPGQYSPPSAEEIRLAIIRAYVENGAQWLDSTSFKPRLGGIIGMSPASFSISSVDLLGCSAPSPSGYRCRYRTDFRMDVPYGIGEKDPAGTVFLDLARNMQRLESPSVDEEEFILTRKGWRSGSLSSKVAAKTWPWDIFGK